jgi:hypothetical protein
MPGRFPGGRMVGSVRWVIRDWDWRGEIPGIGLKMRFWVELGSVRSSWRGWPGREREGGWAHGILKMMRSIDSINGEYSNCLGFVKYKFGPCLVVAKASSRASRVSTRTIPLAHTRGLEEWHDRLEVCPMVERTISRAGRRAFAKVR